MKVSKIHKIVLSSRTRDQLGLDQNTWLANNWQQVAKYSLDPNNINIAPF